MHSSASRRATRKTVPSRAGRAASRTETTPTSRFDWIVK
ncbi:Uncharacterised protein [Mycobacteroides abscessus]|nr:Uncharacterised protein [Mycobacteroides abscessus]